MTHLRFSAFFLAFTLATPLAAWAQEAAGRVLTAVGNVTVVRGAARIVAQRDTPLLSGDQIELGATSNAQIHLTDQTVIALRSDTTFRLTDYVFQEQEGGQRRAFFDLIKGGMRTVSGIIGKFPRAQDYRVTTPTSTVGIRGTHYKLAHTPEGTYGGVTEGRISVTNRSGESIFGSDQYFQVANQDSQAQQLIGPPAILNDRLEGGKRRAGTAAPAPAPSGQRSQTAAAGKETGSEVLAQTGVSGGTGDTRSSGAVAADPIFALPSTTLFQPNAAASVQGPATVLQPTLSGTVFYRLQGPFNIATSNGLPLISGDITLGVNLSLQLAGLAVNVKDSGGGISNFGTPFGSSLAGMPITVSGGQLTFNSTFNRVDFPQNQGAFRCSDCGPSNSPGFFDSITFQGTINGSVADVTISVVDAGGGGGGSASASLTQQTPPNNFVGAMVTPRSAGGADARSQAFWNVQLDASRKLIDIGPAVGGPRANVGSATNTIVGSAPSAGNLVWGAWTGAGAQVTDTNYATFTTGSGAFLPWITGDVTNTLPASLGVQTYTPVGWAMGGSGVFNSGSLTADFVNRSMSLSLNATNPSANNTFQMNGSSSFSSINGRFSAGFTSVTCTGTCTGGTANGSFGGFFAGPNAEGAGVAFTAGFGAGTGVTGAVGFKR